MATDERKHPNRGLYAGACSDICRYRTRLDNRLQERWGISVKLWKTIRALTDLVALLVLAYGIHNGADPTASVLIVGAILVGVEFVEEIVARGDPGSRED
ncbi:MAG: hypothetical protein ABEH81_04095 [Halopenitus sp.]